MSYSDNIVSTIDKKLNNALKTLQDELSSETQLLRHKLNNKLKSLNDQWDDDFKSIQKRKKIVNDHVKPILLELTDILKDKFCMPSCSWIPWDDEPGIQIYFSPKSRNSSPQPKRLKPNLGGLGMSIRNWNMTTIRVVWKLSQTDIYGIASDPAKSFKSDNHKEIIGYLRNQLKALAGDCN